MLDMALQLLARVKQQRVARNFGGNDVLMATYNDLIQEGAELFPADPVLNGQMIKLPDKTLQAFGPLFDIRTMPPELPHQRLEEYLTRFIARLQLKLGLPAKLEREEEHMAINPVVKNASLLLDLMIETSGQSYVPQWLMNQTGLTSKELEAAVALLEQEGAVKGSSSPSGSRYGEFVLEQISMLPIAEHVAHGLRQRSIAAPSASFNQTVINAVNVTIAQNTSGNVVQTIHASPADKFDLLNLLGELKAGLAEMPESEDRAGIEADLVRLQTELQKDEPESGRVSGLWAHLVTGLNLLDHAVHRWQAIEPTVNQIQSAITSLLPH